MLNQQLILPPKQANIHNEILHCCEPVVIIGANGAGKSRFGLWIEENQVNLEKVHRISAQKSLDFPEYVQLKSLEQAEKELTFGTIQDPQGWGGLIPTKKVNRWVSLQRPKLSVTAALDDYEKVLAVLFAKKSQLDSQLSQLVRQMEREGIDKRPVRPLSPDEILLSIWKDLLPHRELTIENGKINVLTSNNNVYQGREMSDGERVALYLMAQCLCVPPDSIIVIDEPELHLHRSLINKFWSKIEEARPNCLFVYITHDLDFATSRIGAKKIWVKSYDGNYWDWDEVPQEEALPERVLLEILGSRKKVIFIESEKGTLDYKIYEAVYPEFLIIPYGGCRKVIEATKAMQDNPILQNHIEAFGIIDRDYRTENEIDPLMEKNIFTLNVAEIENILCVPELLRIVAIHQGFENPSDVCQKAVDLVFKKLEGDLQIQVAKRSASEIQFKLNSFNGKHGVAENFLVEAFNRVVASINVPEIYENNLNLYQSVISSKKYNEALLLYNQKNLHTMIAPLFDLHHKGGYLRLILRLLSSERRNDIVSALKRYTPLI